MTLSLSYCKISVLTVPLSNYLRQTIMFKNKLSILSRNCQSQRAKAYTVKKIQMQIQYDLSCLNI